MPQASLTAVNQELSISFADAGTVIFAISGTYAGFSGAFEVCPDASGTCWFPVQASRSDSAAVETTCTTLTNTVRLWRINTIGMKKARLRCTAIASGTVSAKAEASQQAIDPAPCVSLPGTTPVSIAGAQVAGSNLIGDEGIQYRPNATGAASIKHVIAAATTNATNVKASAGRLVGWSFQNTTATIQYVKLHNTAGTPTPGAAVVMTIGIPANGHTDFQLAGGIGFSTGIAYTIVTGAAATDATATTLNAVVGDLFFA